MKAWIPLTLVFAFGLATHAQATCVYPNLPAAPPNGAKATREEMIAGKQDFDRYNGEMTAFLNCINLEIDAAPKDLKKLTPDEKKKAIQEQKALVQKHNDAVDESKVVVEKFNEQLRIFKARQQ